MKKGRAMKRLLAAAAILALLTGSCSNFFAAKAKGHGSVTVRFAGSSASKRARTIAPDLTTAADSFTVTLTSGSLVHTASLGTGVGSTVFDAVEVGTWDVSVVATAGGASVASGTCTGVSVTAGGAGSANVILAPEAASGTGGISFSFTLGTAATTVNTTLRAGDTDVDTGLTPTLDLEGGGTSLSSIKFTTVPAGSYSLVMDFLAAGGIDLGTFRESVVVYANITSNKWVDPSGNLVASRTFSATELCQQNSSLSGLSIAWADGSAPALTPTFTTDTHAYDAGLVAKGGTVSFTPTSSVSGQSITYVWNGGLPRSIITGQASGPLSLVGGTNSLLITVLAPISNIGCTSTYTVTMQWVPVYSGNTGIEMVKIPAGKLQQRELERQLERLPHRQVRRHTGPVPDGNRQQPQLLYGRYKPARRNRELVRCPRVLQQAQHEGRLKARLLDHRLHRSGCLGRRAHEREHGLGLGDHGLGRRGLPPAHRG